jgi:hypothetical protein
MGVHHSIVSILSGTAQYSSLLEDLIIAVKDGLMNVDATHFKFVHDKV